MPHITNKNQLLDVLTTDTFEQWRVKTNDLIHAYITLPANISDGSISYLKLGLNAAYNNIGATIGGTTGNLIDSTKLSQSASVNNLNDYVQLNTIGSEVGLRGSVLRTGSVALNKLTIVNVAKSRILGTGSDTSSVFTEIEVGTGLTISGTTIILAPGAALANIIGGTIGSEKLAAGAALDNIIGGSIQFGKLNSSAVIDNINNRLSSAGTTPSSSSPLIGFSGQILNLNSIQLDRLYRTASTAYLLGAFAGNSIDNPVKELGLGAGLIIDSTKLSVLFGAGLAVVTTAGTSLGSGTELNKIYVNPAGFSDRSVPLAKLQRTATDAYLLGNTSTGGTQSVKELLLGIGLSVDTATLNVNVKITPNNYNDLIADNSINYRKLTWTGQDVGTVDGIAKGTYPWSTGIVPATDIGILPLAKLERTVTTAAYLLGNTIGAATVTNNLSVNPVKELLLGTGLGISLTAPLTLNVLLGTGLAVVTTAGSADLNKIYVNPAGFTANSVPLAKLQRTATTTAYLLGSTSTGTDVVKELGLGALKINTDNSTIGIISANLDINSVPLNKLERTSPFLATSTASPGAAYILGSTITTGAYPNHVTPAVQQLALTDGLAITTDTPAATIGLSAQGVAIAKLNSGVTTGAFILGGSASTEVKALTLSNNFQLTDNNTKITISGFDFNTLNAASYHKSTSPHTMAYYYNFVDTVNQANSAVSHTYFIEHNFGTTPSMIRVTAICLPWEPWVPATERFNFYYEEGDEIDISNLQSQHIWTNLRDPQQENTKLASITWSNNTYVGITFGGGGKGSYVDNSGGHLIPLPFILPKHGPGYSTYFNFWGTYYDAIHRYTWDTMHMWKIVIRAWK